MPAHLIDQATALCVEVFRLAVWLVLLAAIFVPIERLFGLRPARIMRAGIGADLGYYFLNSLLPGVVLGLPLAFLATAAHRLLPASFLETVAAAPLLLRVAAGLVVGEIGAYWAHRWSHEIPFLWRFHEVHHAPDHIDWLVNTRTHPVDMVFTRLCALAPIYALGLAGQPGLEGSAVPAITLIVAAIWGFFIHANLRWRFGPLEWLIATPAFHHWHHTLEGPINHNYAPTLPWMDKLFGTYHLPRDRWPGQYGVLPPEQPARPGSTLPDQ